jgi:hypothetical protein
VYPKADKDWDPIFDAIDLYFREKTFDNSSIKCKYTSARLYFDHDPALVNSSWTIVDAGLLMNFRR